VISRVADHCFWLGRYLERAENTARVLPVTLSLTLDGDRTARRSWRPILVVSGEEAAFVGKRGEQAAEDAEQVQRYMTWDRENLTSIRSSIAAVRENARSIREVLSLDVWQTVNELWLWMNGDDAEAAYEADREGFYRHIRDACLLVLGTVRNTMLHDLPLDFLWLGVVLERASQTARILDVHSHENAHTHDAVWLALLRACSGLEAFMQRFQGRVGGEAVARFLVLEPSHPRAIRFLVREARERFARIRPPDQPHLPGGKSWARLVALDDRLDGTSELGDVHALLTHVVDEVADVCNELGGELLGSPPPASRSQSQ
jgi:uncharacterized alpha-E superfamily protein